MRTLFIYIIMMLLLAFATTLPSPLSAQTDTVRTEYHEEKATVDDSTFAGKYNYFIRAQIEEKNIIKIGIAPSMIFSYRPIRTHGYEASANMTHLLGIAFEHKFSSAFSGFAQFRPRVFFDDMEFTLAGRYYYNMPKRIREGKSANNFTGNYLSLSSVNGLWRPGVHINRSYTYTPSLKVLYGLQRRLGRIGFFDLNFGPAYDLKAGIVSVNMNFSIGFGL